MYSVYVVNKVAIKHNDADNDDNDADYDDDEKESHYFWMVEIYYYTCTMEI